MFKFQPEEFIVEEITSGGEVLEVDRQITKLDEKLVSNNNFFSHFVLQKRLWTTGNAVRQIADRLHINSGRINFAGNKDRNALTTQLCSAFAIQPERLNSLNIKDIRILGAWLANEKVKLGGLSGNRFTLTLTEENIGKEEFGKLSEKKILSKLKKNNYTLPNYFGDQRFGSARKNTAIVGKMLILGAFKEAVLNYLTCTDEGERDEVARAARKRLSKEMDFGQALNYFPHFLRIEKQMLSHLVNNPNDFLGAFRRLHRPLQLLFIHAYQSYLFNLLLEKRVKGKKLLMPEIGGHYCKLDEFGFPEDEKAEFINSKQKVKDVSKLIKERTAVLLGQLIGYNSALSKGEEKLLAKEKIKKGEFVMKSTPELNSKGALRPNFVFLRDFSCEEFNEGGKRKIRLRFALPSGSYATVALKEILS
ncbi:MAG: tRNA pseudouridine(13) synthase TruD [Candidatus Micrarchaeota archaeon]